MHWWRDPRRQDDLTPEEDDIANAIAARYAPLAVLIALGMVLACIALLWIAGAL